jgi:hypothetical protein
MRKPAGRRPSTNLRLGGITIVVMQVGKGWPTVAQTYRLASAARAGSVFMVMRKPLPYLFLSRTCGYVTSNPPDTRTQRQTCKHTHTYIKANIYIHTWTYTRTQRQTCKHTHTHIKANIYIHTCINTRTQRQTCAYTHAHKGKHIHTHMHKHTHTKANMCIHTDTYTHAHTAITTYGSAQVSASVYNTAAMVQCSVDVCR